MVLLRIDHYTMVNHFLKWYIRGIRIDTIFIYQDPPRGAQWKPIGSVG